MASLATLPFEITLEILSYLRGYDIARLHVTSRALRFLTEAIVQAFLRCRMRCNEFERPQEQQQQQPAGRISGYSFSTAELGKYYVSLTYDEELVEAVRCLHLDWATRAVRYQIPGRAELLKFREARQASSHPLLGAMTLSHFNGLWSTFRPFAEDILCFVMLSSENLYMVKMNQNVMEGARFKILLSDLVTIKLANPHLSFAMHRTRELRLDNTAGTDYTFPLSRPRQRPEKLAKVSSTMLCLFPDLKVLLLSGFRMAGTDYWEKYTKRVSKVRVGKVFNRLLHAQYRTKLHHYLLRTGQMTGQLDRDESRLQVNRVPVTEKERKAKLTVPMPRGIESVHIHNAYIDTSEGGALESILSASSLVSQFSWVIEHPFWGPLDARRVIQLLFRFCHSSITSIRLSAMHKDFLRFTSPAHSNRFTYEGWGIGHGTIYDALALADNQPARPLPSETDFDAHTSNMPRLVFRLFPVLKRLQVDWAHITPLSLRAFAPPSIEEVALDFVPASAIVFDSLASVTRKVFPKLKSVQYYYRGYGLAKSCEYLLKSLLRTATDRDKRLRICPTVYERDRYVFTSETEAKAIRIEIPVSRERQERNFYMLLRSSCSCKTSDNKFKDSERMQQWVDKLDEFEKGESEYAATGMFSFHWIPASNGTKDEGHDGWQRKDDRRNPDSFDLCDPIFKEYPSPWIYDRRNFYDIHLGDFTRR